MFDRKPLVARNADGMPRVVSLGRLSKPKETEAETRESLESMRRENERLLDAMFPEEKIVNFLGEQCSGMIPDRKTILELWELIENKECDAVVAEDLGRVFRNPRWQWAFVQDAYDAGVRVICFSDTLDTADPNWWTAMSIATVRHGMAVQDGQRRIKRKAGTAFELGGEVGKIRFGYARVSREDALAGTYGPKGLRIRRLDDRTWVFDEIRRRFLEGHIPYSVVCWLNADGIKPGPYSKKGEWSLKLLRDNLEHPGLHGTRMFQRELNTQILGTGGYRRDKNPKPRTLYVPELAHMTREQQDEMLAAVGWRINWGGVKPPAPPHPRKGIPRGHSLWPGQSITCTACQEELFVFGDYLKCRNASRARLQTCWNHVLVPKAPLRSFVVNWFVQQYHTSAAFQDTLLRSIKQQFGCRQKDRQKRFDRQGDAVRALEKQEQNLRKSLRIAEEISGEELKSLVTDLTAVTKELTAKRQLIAAVEADVAPSGDMSDVEIGDHLPEILEYLISNSFEMAEVIRGFIPKCIVVPVQDLANGLVHPRVKFFVRSNISDPEYLDELVCDAFEAPLQIRHLSEIVAMRSEVPRPTLKQIGSRLKVSYMTVKRGLAYDRLMKELGATEPFRELHGKPTKASRWRHGA